MAWKSYVDNLRRKIKSNRKEIIAMKAEIKEKGIRKQMRRNEER